MSGLDWLVRSGLADSSRLGIAGGSYGGYLTNWAIANTNRFKAAVTYYGIFNFITDFSNATSPSYEREYFGAYYWEGMGEYYRRSPISRVAGIHTPVLILHGDEDPKTSIANAREMWTALRILGRISRSQEEARIHPVIGMHRVFEVGDVGVLGDVVDRRGGEAELHGGGEILHDAAPVALIIGAATVTLVNNDEIEEVGRVLAEIGGGLTILGRAAHECLEDREE